MTFQYSNDHVKLVRAARQSVTHPGWRRAVAAESRLTRWP